MSFDPLTAAFDLGKIAIEKLFPDPAQKAKAILELETMKQNGDLAQLNAHVQLMVGQLAINQEEAKHPHIFVSGWRPAVGWTGAISLFVMYVPKAIVMTGFWCYQAYVTISSGGAVLPIFPDLGAMDIIGLLGSILGVGAMRSFDKSKGVDTKGVSK